MANRFDNVTDESIIGDIVALETEKAAIDTKIKQAKNALLERKSEEIQAALRQKEEPFGATSLIVGNKKVTFTTPKKVEWYQAGLSQVFHQMIADGADPSEYLKIEYGISEASYKAWPNNVKAYFEPYRTVTPGNISIKIEEVKE